MRLSSDTVVISSALNALRPQANGLVAATALIRSYAAPLSASAWRGVSPQAATVAFSYSG